MHEVDVMHYMTEYRTIEMNLNENQFTLLTTDRSFSFSLRRIVPTKMVKMIKKLAMTRIK